MFKLLFLINLRVIFADILGGIGGTKKNSSKMLIVLIGGISLLLFTGTIGSMFVGVLDFLKLSGSYWAYFTIFGFVFLVISLLSVLFIGTSYLFDSKDNMLMLTLPITGRDLLMSRLMALLFLELLFSLPLMAPVVIVWCVRVSFSFLDLIFFIVGTLLISLLSLSVVVVLSWLFSLISKKCVISPILKTMFSLVFVFFLIYINFTFQRYAYIAMENSAKIAEVIKGLVPPLYYYGLLVTEHNISNFLLLCLWTIVPFIVVTLLLLPQYKKLLMNSEREVFVEYAQEKQVKTSTTWALVKKDLSFFWNSNVVMLNTGFGIVLALCFSIFLLLFKYNNSLFNNIVRQDDVFLEFATLFPNFNVAEVAVIILVFFVITLNLSASLISLEGRNFWFLKTLPVSSKKMILAKLYACMLLYCIPYLAFSLIAIVVTVNNLAEVLLLLFLPQLSIIAVIIFGFLLNLHYPKFDWIKEANVVKQSLPSAISAIFALVFQMGLLGLYFLFLRPRFLMTFMSFLSLYAVVLIMLIGLMYWYLMKKGEKKFSEIQ